MRIVMQRKIAEQIMDAMKKTESALGELLDTIENVEDAELRRSMVDQLFKTIHFLHVHVTLPVANEFPDLHPDGYSRTY
jgi:hypothetical protein